MVLRNSPVTMLAAGIAYYALISIFPLLLLLLAVATTLGGEAIALLVLDQLSGILTPSGEELVRDALLGDGVRGGATLLGLAVLLWSGLKLFRGIDVAFSTIYGTYEQKDLVGQFRNALLALLAVGAAITATVALSIVATIVGLELVGVASRVGLFVVLTVVFLPLYYIFPDIEMTPRDALPGAVFAAGGWTLLGLGFQLYTEGAGGGSLYGVVGGVLLLVTWFYLGGLVLLLGAVFNGVWSGDLDPAVSTGTADRQLQQGPLRGGAQRAMSESGDDERVSSPGPNENVQDLRAEIDELQERIDERTLHRDEVEKDLKRYVRRRVRRGHATDWGPYVVLLYGTIMTLGAFYLLSDLAAMVAMLVVWLSVLGLYVVMLVVGFSINVLGIPSRLRDRIQEYRS